MTRKTLLCALAALSMSGTAHANQFKLDFLASGFAGAGGGTTAPQDTVSGSFVYEAASATDPAVAVDSVNLTIAGHTYTVGEVFGTAFLFWNAIVSAGGPTLGTNGFELVWVPVGGPIPNAPFELIYSTAADTTETWATQTFDSFSITAVPEPASLALFAIGGAAMGWRRRKAA